MFQIDNFENGGDNYWFNIADNIFINYKNKRLKKVY